MTADMRGFLNALTVSAIPAREPPGTPSREWGGSQNPDTLRDRVPFFRVVLAGILLGEPVSITGSQQGFARCIIG